MWRKCRTKAAYLQGVEVWGSYLDRKGPQLVNSLLLFLVFPSLIGFSGIHINKITLTLPHSIKASLVLMKVQKIPFSHQFHYSRLFGIFQMTFFPTRKNGFEKQLFLILSQRFVFLLYLFKMDKIISQIFIQYLNMYGIFNICYRCEIFYPSFTHEETKLKLCYL